MIAQWFNRWKSLEINITSLIIKLQKSRFRIFITIAIATTTGGWSDARREQGYS